ncbi:MAG: nucleotide sugar dehydrogenase [Deltaproteobacteria bacterium]|nr:nucleotide sugar dehydrogenase [Deltaproteobacteria bacterium]
MRVGVFGLGYVGSVMAGCLTAAGHEVIGVDVQADRVEGLGRGQCPVSEPGLAARIRSGADAGLLRASLDPAEAVSGSQLSFICTGTPALDDGSLDCASVEAVCAQIGQALRDGSGTGRHGVLIRSTVMPGTAARCARRLADACGDPTRFFVGVNPEFLREGSAVSDFGHPPFTLVGLDEPSSAAPIRELYAFVSAPFVLCGIAEAEVYKLICNAWHAAKVCFGNEVGRLCSALGADPHAIMDLFVRDERLNVSAAYLRPGFAFGGSCLPKDLGAVRHLARTRSVDLPMIEGLPRSNRRQIELACERIAASGCRRVAFLGLSFKPGTDDLRRSPSVALVEFCLGKGIRVKVYDPGVDPERLVGSNRRFVEQRLGHLSDHLRADPADLADAELFVLSHADADMLELCRKLPAGKRVLDLVHAIQDPGELAAEITGLCW